MNLTMLKGKIHRATVTEAKLNYVGSITIDSKLLDASNILEYEKVDVVNISNGARIQTYTIKGEPDSGIICLNGAAARHFSEKDKIIIMAYCTVDALEAKTLKPLVVFVDDKNKISKIGHYEKHGEIH